MSSCRFNEKHIPASLTKQNVFIDKGDGAGVPYLGVLDASESADNDERLETCSQRSICSR